MITIIGGTVRLDGDQIGHLGKARDGSVAIELESWLFTATELRTIADLLDSQPREVDLVAALRGAVEAARKRREAGEQR